MAAMTTAAVLLAAGAGTRFAGPHHKLLAPLRGRPVVAWALEHACEAGLDETVVVVGAPEVAAAVRALASPAATVLDNADWRDGQATSLQVAVAHARRVGHDAVVVGLGDTPFVPAEAWQLVASADATIAVALLDGQRSPPVLLRAAVWDELPVAGDEGARVLLRRRPDLVREVACPGSPADIDTVEDLQPWI